MAFFEGNKMTGGYGDGPDIISSCTINVNKGEIVECDANKNLNIIDLTGAGDLFAAGYLHGTINNLTTKESLLKGTELSSKIIQKIGARI